jgi:hypothetical protein
MCRGKTERRRITGRSLRAKLKADRRCRASGCRHSAKFSRPNGATHIERRKHERNDTSEFSGIEAAGLQVGVAMVKRPDVSPRSGRVQSSEPSRPATSSGDLSASGHPTALMRAPHREPRDHDVALRDLAIHRYMPPRSIGRRRRPQTNYYGPPARISMKL